MLGVARCRLPRRCRPARGRRAVALGRRVELVVLAVRVRGGQLGRGDGLDAVLVEEPGQPLPAPVDA